MASEAVKQARKEREQDPAFREREKQRLRTKYRLRSRDPRIRAKNLARRREKRAELLAWLDAIKIAQGCCDCGYRQHPKALDFDHRDRAQKAGSVANLACWGNAMGPTIMARIRNEIAKCDVRCSNCHRIRTFDRDRLWKQTHEDEVDLKEARKALREAKRAGTVPYEKVRKELGLA